MGDALGFEEWPAFRKLQGPLIRWGLKPLSDAVRAARWSADAMPPQQFLFGDFWHSTLFPTLPQAEALAVATSNPIGIENGIRNGGARDTVAQRRHKRVHQSGTSSEDCRRWRGCGLLRVESDAVRVRRSWCSKVLVCRSKDVDVGNLGRRGVAWDEDSGTAGTWL